MFRTVDHETSRTGGETLPAAFVPLNGVLILADYVLGAGNLVATRVRRQVDLSTRVEIDRIRLGYLPQAGHIAGRRSVL